MGVAHRLDSAHFYFNATRGFYCMRGGAAISTKKLGGIRLAGADGAASEGGGAERDKCLAASKGRLHPRVDPVVLEKLRAFFRPHNQRFYSLVGVDYGW